MKKILILLGIILAPVFARAQNIEGNPPHTIDRAMSPWARDRVNANSAAIFGEVDSLRSGDASFTKLTVSGLTALGGNLTITGSYPGLLGTFITNTYTGAVAVAGAVHQVTNDNGYWGLIGMTNSGSTILGGIFANTLHFYNQGYANTLNTVDGNKDFVWFTDPTNQHDFTALSNEVMRLKADGELQVQEITYEDTYWDDLRVPLSATRISPVNTEPDFEDRGDGMFAWGFDADSDSTWVLNFTSQTPHKRKDSTDLEAHIHWDPETTAAGNVVWKLIISTANINGEWTATDTLRIVAAAGEVALQYQLDDFGMVPGSDTLRISSGILGSIGRMGDAADDTYPGIAYGVEIDFHYQIDSPGSREETTK